MWVTRQPVLRRFWYAVMPLVRLSAGPQRFTLLGEKLVLWLQPDGTPAARRAIDPDVLQPSAASIAAPAPLCQARYGHVWVALAEPLRGIFDIPEDSDPGYRRIEQFDARWRTGALRLMENSFDAAHFAFVHKGTFGQFSQQKPEFFELRETDHGFEAETLLTINNPPASHRITGTTEPTTKRHFRNQWHLPFSRRLGLEYPNGLRHVIFTCATPVDDHHIQLLQWLYRNDTEADCPAALLNDWDGRVIEEDREILESVDPNAPVDVARREEFSMPSDRPGLIMRRQLLELLQAHGEKEVYESADTT
ncbi:Rieske (2Fe-2S) protein [Burkholderiales bacterium 8X]|nr:Rieske (2Fe-2S) protein [Burkholderiales bacterium 8X]